MEKKYYCSWSHVLLLKFLIVFFMMNMVAVAQNDSSIRVIRVGVVLDKDDAVGELGLHCISMALSDFYATNGRNYTTRIALSIRDSKGNAIGAAAAALDLLKNVEVKAIIGPLFSSQASFLINLGDQAQVPIVTFSATSPSLSSLRSPYFVRATLNDSSQALAISEIVKAFGWREIVPIYVDNEFGEGIIPYLTDALEQVNTRVPYRSIIHPLATDDQIVSELYKLMSMQTRVFVVHMLGNLGSRFFAKATQLGMMSEDYAWIITDGMTDELNLVDPLVVESMLGVIGLKPYIPQTNELNQFKRRYKRSLRFSNSTTLSRDITIFGLRAYDSATALALAVEKARVTNARTFQESNVSRNSTDLESFGVSSQGANLIEALSGTTFEGLAGEFRLVFGQLQTPPYEIVNVVGHGARGVGYWTKENGIIKQLNFTNTNVNYSSSTSTFRSIIWPGDRTSPPKGWIIPTNGKKLRIGVPVKEGFTEFVRVTWNSDNSTKVEGHCIDIFDAVMATMPYGVNYEYIPFADSKHKAAGSYQDLTYQVKLGNYDAVVGDIGIQASRSEYVDFTLPFTQSTITMVAPIHDTRNKDALVFLKPLTFELWITAFCSFIFIGSLTWIIEHRINQDLRGTFRHQVGLIFWFAFSTVVFSQKEKVVSNLSRFLLLIWFLVVLVLTSSYTANLTAMLTVKQLQPTVTDINTLIRNREYVGYQRGAFVFDTLKRLNFDESRLLPFGSVEEMHDLFVKGSGNGGIAAAIDEVPYMKLFIGKYCSKFAMVTPGLKTDGFGFVFPIGSPLVRDVSRAILKVTDDSGNKIEEIERTWFGDKTKCEDFTPSPSSNSLGLDSFWMLFVIVGGLAFLALVFYFTRFIYQNWAVDVKHNASLREKIVKLFEKFLAKDPNAFDFRNKGHDDCKERVVVLLPHPNVPDKDPIAPVAPGPEELETINPRKRDVQVVPHQDQGAETPRPEVAIEMASPISQVQL